MSNRHGNSGLGYEYGFQNQENDNEIAGKGNRVNYKYRMHDTRIGRFFAVDPLANKYAYNSTYAFSENQVIRFVELEGLEKAEPSQFAQASEMIDHKLNLIKNGFSDKTMVKGLSMTSLLNDLKKDINDPESATCQNTGGGYYCGKSALQSVSLSYDPVGYLNYITTLATKGEAQWNDKGASTKLDKGIIKNGLAGDDRSSGEIFGTSLNSSTKNKSPLRLLANVFGALKDEGNSHPYEMKRMMKRVGLKPKLKKIYRNFDESDITNIGLIDKKESVFD